MIFFGVPKTKYKRKKYPIIGKPVNIRRAIQTGLKITKQALLHKTFEARIKEKNYFCALLYRYTARMLNTIFGVQAANSGGKLPFVANTMVNLLITIYKTLISKPSAR